MNLDRLSMGEKLLGASSALLFLLSFAGIWAKVDAEAAGFSESAGFNAWSELYNLLLKLAIVLALVAAVLVIARVANVQMTLPWSNVYRGVAFTVLALLILTLVLGPDETGSGSNEFGSVEISRGIGLFIGTLLALAMAAGAWMHAEEPGAATATPPAAPA